MDRWAARKAIRELRGGMESGKVAIELNVKRLDGNAVLPTRGTGGSAGLDISSTEDVTLHPDDISFVHTGLAMEIPEGYMGILATRSSMGARGIRVAAGMNIIDCDYRGEVMVVLRNDGLYDYCIRQGDRIAQLAIVPYMACGVAEVTELSETGRGGGGFGSTGR